MSDEDEERGHIGGTLQGCAIISATCFCNEHLYSEDSVPGLLHAPE